MNREKRLGEGHRICKVYIHLSSEETVGIVKYFKK